MKLIYCITHVQLLPTFTITMSSITLAKYKSQWEGTLNSPSTILLLPSWKMVASTFYSVSLKATTSWMPHSAATDFFFAMACTGCHQLRIRGNERHTSYLPCAAIHSSGTGNHVEEAPRVEQEGERKARISCLWISLTWSWCNSWPRHIGPGNEHWTLRLQGLRQANHSWHRWYTWFLL